MDRLLTVSQTLERLAISRDKFYELIRSGELQSLTIGRARRIPESSVDRFISERLTAGDAA